MGNESDGKYVCLNIVIQKELTDTKLTEDFSNNTEENCGNDNYLCTDSNTVSELSKKEVNNPYRESPCLDTVMNKELTDTVLTEDFSNNTEENCGQGNYLHIDSNTVSELSKTKANDPNGKSTCLDTVIQNEITDTKLPEHFSNITEENSGNDLCTDSNTVSETWKDYVWTCDICETKFPLIDELIAHTIQYHGRCNAYKCNDCNIRNLSLDKFIVHVKRHRNVLRQSCYKCHVLVSSQYHANEHKRTHFTSKHKCEGCNSTFESATELKQHMDTYYLATRYKLDKVRQTTAGDLTCRMCNKSFNVKHSWKKHLLTHTERKRDYICEICGKCFVNKHTLAGHVRLHDKSCLFQCELCKLTFKTKSNLRRHVKIHDNNKLFTCDQCGRSFRTKKLFETHSIIHTDLYPHVCTYCNKGFRVKSILNNHIRQHTGERPYSCKSCQMYFTNWPNYNKHMKRRHGKNMAKTKRTLDGVFRINPSTGDVVDLTMTNQTLEWKRQLMTVKKPAFFFFHLLSV